jgi:2-keto-4-pentenoate hydratase
MDDAACGLVAQELREALQTRLPIDPIRRSHPGLTVDDAYAIQLSQVAAWQRDGQQVQGHKVGLTSAAMQRQLGVDQPDYGHLYDTMFHLEGLPIALGDFISPKVEPEMAPGGLDLALEGCLLGRNGEIVDTAAGAAVQGHPAEALALAANELGRRGHAIEAGWIVLTGGLTDAISVGSGQEISAEFTNLGSLTLVGA